MRSDTEAFPQNKKSAVRRKTALPKLGSALRHIFSQNKLYCEYFIIYNYITYSTKSQYLFVTFDNLLELFDRKFSENHKSDGVFLLI